MQTNHEADRDPVQNPVVDAADEDQRQCNDCISLRLQSGSVYLYEMWQLLMDGYKTIHEYNVEFNKHYMIPHGSLRKSDARWWTINKMIRTFNAFILSRRPYGPGDI